MLNKIKDEMYLKVHLLFSGKKKSEGLIHKDFPDLRETKTQYNYIQ